MTHTFDTPAPTLRGQVYRDQHGCLLYDDGHQVRLYWRTRYDAHLYRGSLQEFLTDGAPYTSELGGGLRLTEVWETHA